MIAPVPDDERSPPGSEIEMYYANLGRFVTRFAEVEASLRTLCAIASEMAPQVAAMFLGDLPVSAAARQFVRLRESKGLPDDPEINDALRQLKKIAAARNAILHRGVRVRDGKLVTAPGLYGVERADISVSAETVAQMYDDLAIILVALLLWRPQGYDGYDEWEAGIRKVAQTPWRYTPQP